jgi:hypothetical protein
MTLEEHRVSVSILSYLIYLIATGRVTATYISTRADASAATPTRVGAFILMTMSSNDNNNCNSNRMVAAVHFQP